MDTKKNQDEKSCHQKMFFLDDISNISFNVLKVAHTKLPASWGYENTPAYNKLYYLKRGRFHFEIDGKVYEGCPGQMFLLPCNSKQLYHAYYDADATKYWIHFSSPCRDRDLLEMVSLPHFITVENPDVVDEMFHKIIECSRETDMEKVILQKAYCMQLLAYYIHESTFEPLRVVKDERVVEIGRYIAENLSKNITLSDLASVAHFNPNYFVKYFKRLTGKSPMEYLLDYRISKAKTLLQNREIPIKDIAFSVGFKSPDHFSHVFKEYTGYSPMQYRKMAIRIK